MSTTAVPPPIAVPNGTGLKITATVFGAIGLAVWGTSIGLMIGWDYSDVGGASAVWGSIFSVPTNAAMIYVACRLIFLIMDRSFGCPSSLQDLHTNVARMVALTVIGFSTWIVSVIWLATRENYWSGNQYYDSYVVYHSCNYGFVLSSIVAGVAGGLLHVAGRNNALPPVQAVAPKYTGPQPQAHYNPAYAHHYSQQYRV